MKDENIKKVEDFKEKFHIKICRLICNILGCGKHILRETLSIGNLSNVVVVECCADDEIVFSYIHNGKVYNEYTASDGAIELDVLYALLNKMQNEKCLFYDEY